MLKFNEYLTEATKKNAKPKLTATQKRLYARWQKWVESMGAASHSGYHGFSDRDGVYHRVYFGRFFPPKNCKPYEKKRNNSYYMIVFEDKPEDVYVTFIRDYNRPTEYIGREYDDFVERAWEPYSGYWMGKTANFLKMGKREWTKYLSNRFEEGPEPAD